MSRSRVATTRSASMLRSTTMAGHSRVYSSTMFNSFRMRPSTVTSNWKSRAPQGVRGDGGHDPHGGADAGQRLLAFPVGHFQPFGAPQPLDAFVVHHPPFPARLLDRSP